jgi:Dihydroorotate dehydrogenase
MPGRERSFRQYDSGSELLHAQRELAERHAVDLPRVAKDNNLCVERPISYEERHGAVHLPGTQLILELWRYVDLSSPILGVGGVKDGASALEKFRAGASLVQVMAGLRGEGLGVAQKINRQLVAWMERSGVSSIAEIVGLDSRAAR